MPTKQSSRAAKNRNNGKAAEILVANRHLELKLDVIVNRIERIGRQYTSLPDIEFPEIKFVADVKFTEAYFTPEQKYKLWLKCIEKYGNECYCIFVEKNQKNRFDPRMILIYYNKQVMYYDDFLYWLCGAKN